MATSYPGSIDTFTDPGPTDTMDGNGGVTPALDHDAQHTNINDSVHAIETFVGTSSAPNFVNGASIAAVTTATEAYAYGITKSASVLAMQTAVYDPAGIDQQLVGTTAAQTVTGKRITKRVLALNGVSVTSQPTINTDLYDVVHFTGMSASISSMSASISGSPVDGDTLRISFTDNGTARAITWGTGSQSTWAFETAAELPTTTSASVRLDTAFFWNTETSKWRCEGSIPGPVILYGDCGSVSANSTVLGATATAIFANASQPALPTLSPGTYRVDFDTNLTGGSSATGVAYSFMVAGGTATYAVVPGPTAAPPGAAGSMPGATGAADRPMVHMTAYIIVTAAGTVNIEGIAGTGAVITCSCRDITFGAPVLTTTVAFQLIG